MLSKREDFGLKLQNLPRSYLGRNLPPVARRLPFIEKRKAQRLNRLPDVVRPLIVVPGILGTWPPAPAPRGRLDPITWAYRNLLDALRTIGYVPGVSLFSFPYDWRRSVNDLAGELGAEISRIKQLSPSRVRQRSSVPVDYSRVDLLCHSMGGVIGRAYVQSEAYKADVSRLVLVAVPQSGSTAAYYAHEGGDSTRIGIPITGAQSMVLLADAFDAGLSRRRARLVYQALSRRSSKPDLYLYMRQQLHSIKDFLPLGSQNYLYQLDEAGEEELYPFGSPPGYPRNDLLENINQPDLLARLDSLDEIHCFYSSSVPTLNRLQVEPSRQSPFYEYGQPVAQQPAANFEPGDSVVTVSSTRLDLPECKPDGQPWQVRVINEDISQILGCSVSHVGVAAEPDPVRHLLTRFMRPDAEPLTAQAWDGPPLSARRPNYRALVV